MKGYSHPKYIILEYPSDTKSFSQLLNYIKQNLWKTYLESVLLFTEEINSHMRRSHRKLGNAPASSFSFFQGDLETQSGPRQFSIHTSSLSPNLTKRRLDQTAFICQKIGFHTTISIHHELNNLLVLVCKGSQS